MRAAAPHQVTLKRLKYAVAIRRSRVECAQEHRPYIGLENIESSTGRLIGDPAAPLQTATSLTGDAESLCNTFEPGDVLFNKLRPYLAKAWIAAFPGRCTTELLVMQPMENESRFLRYVCLSRDFINAVNASTFGSKMPRADWDFIGNMPIPVPPLSQQRAIADYLDRETARLDSLVAAKERVLGLLAEKRRALVTRAVTRGLDPHATLRDSGIPWLGKIPAHWEVMRAGLAGCILMGRQRAPRYENGSHQTPYLRVANVFDGFIDYSDVLEMNFEPAEQALFGLAPGDVLLNEGQSRELVGRSAIYRNSHHKHCFQNTLIRFRCGKNLSPEFAQAQFSSWLEAGVFQSFSRQSTNIAHLGADRLAQIHMAVPPVKEQHAIIERIECENERTDSMRAATERTISLLKERRAALIAAAVTGQRSTSGTNSLARGV